MKKFGTRLLIAISGCFFALSAFAYDGKIVDANTKAPIADAIVTLGNDVTRTTKEGAFHIEGAGDTLKLRAVGYTRQDVPTANLNPQTDIALTPFTVKALYLTGYGLASHSIRDGVLETAKNNHLNALVIDVKGDRGLLTFKLNVPMAQQIGAENKILIKDMPTIIANLKSQGFYLIGRIVTFKDNVLATAKPEWAVKKGNGLFTDHEHLHWADPFREEVWDYNISLAKAAAEAGFDEIQFDYVRCPDTKGVVFSQPSNMESRTKTITGFLQKTHKALVPYNVMMSADIFGYVPWNTNDTGIGQQIEQVVNAVDIVSPMLYPSGFQFGIPNYRNPVENPYKVIYLSLKRAQERTHVSPLRFRPWLQAFHDYAFHGGDFYEERMRAQIQAVEDFGGSGYMFWNPRNVYPKGVFTDTHPHPKKNDANKTDSDEVTGDDNNDDEDDDSDSVSSSPPLKTIQ